jgi:hypothetical protein
MLSPDNLLLLKYIIVFSFKIYSFDIQFDSCSKKTVQFLYSDGEIVPFEVDANLRLSPILSSLHSGLNPSQG